MVSSFQLIDLKFEMLEKEKTVLFLPAMIALASVIQGNFRTENIC